MTATFNLNKTALIKRALQTVNIIDLNASPDNDVYTLASDLLNLMLKKWEAMGINLWKRKIGYLFTALNTANYELGNSGTNATLSYHSTTLSSAHSANATSLSVSSTSGMTVGDYIGIKLDDSSRQWTTISTIPDSTSLTIATGLTTTAASGNTVVAYTTKISRPVLIVRGTCKDISSSGNNTESQMRLDSYNEYFNMPLKSTSGKPNNIYYDRLLNSTTPYTGTLYSFPVSNNVDYVITFTFQESLSDMINSTDYADVPQEWLYAVIMNLGCELGYYFGKYQELQVLEPKAQRELELVKQFDSDDAPVRFTLGTRRS